MKPHNHDLQINPNTAVDNNPMHEAVLFYWGERCPDHEDGCPVCEAWKQYDNMQERIEKHEAAHKAEFNKYVDKLVEGELAERKMLAEAKAYERLSSLLEDFTQEETTEDVMNRMINRLGEHT